MPGTFASPVSVEKNDTEVAAQLQRYWDFALNDSRIFGFDPWHDYNRSGALDESSVAPYVVCVEAMPQALALLQKLGEFIVAAKSTPTLPQGCHRCPCNVRVTVLSCVAYMD